MALRRLNSRAVLLIAASVLGGAKGSAQSASQGMPATVTGSAFDSLSYGPLVGAVVQVVRAPLDSVDTAPRRTWTAVTDSLGDFRLQLPVGHYFLGFQHPTLSALGLESPVKALEISDKDPSSVQLAIPSPRTVRTLLCPGVDSAHVGVITGMLSAQRGASDLRDAELLAEWGDVIVKASRIVPVARQQDASVDDGGVFRLCGLPSSGSVGFSARVKGFHPITADLVVGDDGLLRVDLHLVPLADVRGPASIIVQLTDSTQPRSLAGTVTIPALQRATTVSAGVDTLRDLPEGTWALQVRAIGYVPRTILVEARPAEIGGAPVTVRMVPLAQTLAPVRVIAKRDQRVLDDIDERMRVAAGTLIRAGDPFLATATEPSDAIRAGRGFRWKGPTEIETMRSLGGCKTVTSNTPSMRDRLSVQIAVYLDGARVPGGLETLNNMIRPDEILALETYPEISSAPSLWRTRDACAVVAFWTKHRAGS